ncbi:sulfur carrier protein ThiS [Microbispora triticiradicis]|uniref:Sulfur carrier protein ThiS n=2 Tax=Microbispora TaxID=2005 RepID=A0ABY3LZC7_9ACTN|nr:MULTISPECIES: sulfur carrier protein ThiS [Microbispora]TLP53165.1 sulfur carrier protein ThiS [Microbispora fusca]TYB60065.1 sulfur carrier protein ThiS [Microbispora tritici]GLW21098.1 thiamine biosynthesis protein ThiS [Microbispora amethystogenes]
MKVTINGDPAELPEGATVGDAVRILTALTSGVAVAVNGEVVSRSAWESTRVEDGDGVEVLTAVQGG